jgi:molybdate transport repressor ModE-like protein
MHKIAYLNEGSEMYKVEIKPNWSIQNETAETPSSNTGLHSRTIEVLTQVHQLGSVASACKALNLSYRHAWELIRQGDLFFGQPLMTLEQGRGSSLTALGEKLVWADRRITARLSPALDTLASELSSELDKLLTVAPPSLRIQASHGFAVQTLNNLLSVQKVAHEIKYCASQEALAALKAGDCHLAGFHIPLGQFEAACVNHFSPWLDRKKHRLIHVATRRQGLIVAANNPKKIVGLKDLTRSDVRFINRQPSSGTRFLLDLMLKKEKIDISKIRGYEHSELTHAAVAAFVASDMADVAYGIETPARQFNLDFVPIQTERYFFLCSADSLVSDSVKSLLKTLQNEAYKRSVNALAGYDASGSGHVTTLKEAFA